MMLTVRETQYYPEYKMREVPTEEERCYRGINGLIIAKPPKPSRREIRIVMELFDDATYPILKGTPSNNSNVVGAIDSPLYDKIAFDIP
jgi:hypothetical protein